MENKYGIVGVAHIGLPTNDLQKTVEFYKSLGFEVIMQSDPFVTVQYPAFLYPPPTRFYTSDCFFQHLHLNRF